MSDRKTFDQYRIMSKPPGARTFKHRSFTGAGPTANLDHVRQGLKWAIDSSPGWEFRLETRRVTTETTQWKFVREETRA